MTAGLQGGLAPNSCDGLAFRSCIIGIRFSGPSLIWKRIFEKGYEERDLEYKDSALDENTKIWWRFSDTMNREVDFAP